jgi:superfamily II DNA helicase RecQ
LGKKADELLRGSRRIAIPIDLADTESTTSLKPAASVTHSMGRRVSASKSKSSKTKANDSSDDSLSSPDSDGREPVLNAKDVYAISSDFDLSSACFDDIVRLRERVCVDEKIPPPYFLSNSVIREISRVLPQNMEELARIEGLNGKKVASYGELILSETKKYV